MAEAGRAAAATRRGESWAASLFWSAIAVVPVYALVLRHYEAPAMIVASAALFCVAVAGRRLILPRIKAFLSR